MKIPNDPYLLDEVARVGAPGEQRRLASSTVLLGSQALVLILGNAFTLCVALPLQIYVARALGAGGLGIFALFEGTTGLLVGFLLFGIAPTVVRFIPHHIEKGEFQLIHQLLLKSGTVLAIGGALGYFAMLISFPYILFC